MNYDYIHICIAVIICAAVLSCHSPSKDNSLDPPEEIVERMYSKFATNDEYKYKYEALYHFENELLRSRSTRSDKDKISKEKWFYDENNQLISTQTFNKDMMLFEEKLYYDEEGKWKNKQTFNTIGDKIADLQVTERINGVVKGTGYIRKNQVRFYTKNQGKDSVMLRQIITGDQARYQKWRFLKNDNDDILSIRGFEVDLVAPESFEVINDSLIASFDYYYHFPPNCEDWSLMISDGYYQAKSDKMVNRRDSILRINVSLENTQLTNELMAGYWQIREMPASSYQFLSDGRYRAYSGNQLAEKGTWNILNSKEKIMFQAIGLGDKKTVKFWNIQKVFKDKINIMKHDEIQSVVRLNKDFTFYKFEN